MNSSKSFKRLIKFYNLIGITNVQIKENVMSRTKLNLFYSIVTYILTSALFVYSFYWGYINMITNNLNVDNISRILEVISVQCNYYVVAFLLIINGKHQIKFFNRITQIDIELMQKFSVKINFTRALRIVWIFNGLTIVRYFVVIYLYNWIPGDGKDITLLSTFVSQIYSYLEIFMSFLYLYIMFIIVNINIRLETINMLTNFHLNQRITSSKSETIELFINSTSQPEWLTEKKSVFILKSLHLKLLDSIQTINKAFGLILLVMITIDVLGNVIFFFEYIANTTESKFYENYETFVAISLYLAPYLIRLFILALITTNTTEEAQTFQRIIGNYIDSSLIEAKVYLKYYFIYFVYITFIVSEY